jgi:spore maturation protein SpmB
MGLENGATPFGIKAMKELERLNSHPGTATDAMVLFVAINTANVTLFPHQVVVLRAALGSIAPGSIVLPTLLATLISTATAIVAAKVLAPRFPIRPREGAPTPEETVLAETTPAPSHAPVAPAVGARRWLALLLAAAVAGALAAAFWIRPDVRQAASTWILPVVVAAIVVWGLGRGVPVYEKAVEGGREAFDVVLRILPYLVLILVATAMLRASGAFDLLLRGVQPVAAWLHIPAEAIPMGLMRSLSGSGARGLAADLMKTHGPDSFVGNVVSVIQGSTETTFYVLAVYFGAARVRAARHALIACLLADAVGVLASVAACRLLL